MLLEIGATGRSDPVGDTVWRPEGQANIQSGGNFALFNDDNNNNNNNVECKTKSDTSNNRGEWDYFKVIQKIREQHTGKI